MKKRVSIRLDESLMNFEAAGFKNITEFIETSLKNQIESKNPEISKTGEALEKVFEVIQYLEAVRDSGSISDEETGLLDSCYKAAKELASTKIMLESPLNLANVPEELRDNEEETGKVYKFNWAL